MGEAHEEGAGVLDLCNANGLRLSTPSRARSAPCASAAWRAFRLHTPYFRKFFLLCPPRRPMFYPYNTKFKAPNSWYRRGDGEGVRVRDGRDTDGRAGAGLLRLFS